jgi:AraC-like DNA-binding protein
LLVPRRTLHDYLSRYLDLPVARPIHFTLDRPAGDPALKSLVQFLYWTCLQLDDEYSLLSRGHTARETEDLILAQLIRLEGHSYTEWVQRERPVPAPGFVRRVEDYIQARAGDEITMDDLVEVSGVSASTLFRGFRRFRGMGPMAYLKQVRLDRAREDLIRSDHRETTVTAIATRWRLFHLGNFAADYTRRFGEAPSATLRAAPNAKR